MRKTGVMIATLAIVALSGCAKKEAGAEKGTAADEQAIRNIATQYADAWSKHDMAGVTALMADDYEDVDPTGRHTTSRAQADSNMTKDMAQLPAGMAMTAATTYVKWLDEDAAVVGGTYQMSGGMPGMPTQGSWMAVAVKRDGSWKMLSALGAADLTPMMASDTGTVKRQ